MLLDIKIFRIVDANLNRLREALRVIEDYHRFLKPNKVVGLRLKALRHRLQILEKTLNLDNRTLLASRDSENDFGGKTSTASEKKRTDLHHILIANHKRAQESSRVLEEFVKIISPRRTAAFKAFRFELYQIEKISSR